MRVSIPVCLDLCFHTLVRLDLCSLNALCYLPCACALHAMFVCLDLGYVCLSFLCFGLLVWIRSRPYGFCHYLYTLAHIKGFGSFPFCMSILTCFYALCFVLASLVLGFATLDAFSGLVVVWLHLTPMRPCFDVTIWDASP